MRKNKTAVFVFTLLLIFCFTRRFLRHVPVIYVDHPGAASLKQIYGTFNRAMLRMVPSLRPYADPLTNSMVEFYTMSQERFTQVCYVQFVQYLESFNAVR